MIGEVYLLNKNLELVYIVDNYKSCIWANRYVEIGDCELYVPATYDLFTALKIGYYLIRQNDEMICRIKKIELDTDAENGDYIIITGKDTKDLCDQRIIWSTLNCTGKLEPFVRKIVNSTMINSVTQARNMVKENGQPLVVLGTSNNFKDVLTEQVSYDNAGVKIREYCTKCGWGYKMVRDGTHLKFVLYKGSDRSAFVYFSDDYENLDTTQYLLDDTNLGNVALVGGEGEGSKRIKTTSGHAFTEIFGKGNSFESLFEITYDEQLNNNNRNNYIGNYYFNGGSNQSNGRLAAIEEFYEGLPINSTELFNNKDCRVYGSIYQAGTTQFYIAKYAANEVVLDNTKSNWTPSYRWRSTNYAHWIVYRLTDVMLMKAEALVQQGDQHFEEAFSLINAVSRRAVNSFVPGTGEILVFDDYKESKESMEQLVMDERHRELMFEGKRWFDLLREARRTGNTRDLAKTGNKKQLTNISGIQIRLADPNALYLPYYRNEVKVNPYLHQNPAYNTGEDADLEKN